MTFADFSALTRDAKDQPDHDKYISERGWQDWMDEYGETHTDKIIRVLELAWIAANGVPKQLREMTGLPRAEWCRLYDIPLRTAENWDAEVRSAPDYLRALIAYSAIEEKWK